MNQDLDLLERVCAIKDFIGRALFDDDLPDWSLAREYGLFLMGLGHDDLLAHLLVGRASRHLGDGKTAAAEVRRCRDLIAAGEALVDPAVEPLLETLWAEERFLGSTEQP